MNEWLCFKLNTFFLVFVFFFVFLADADAAAAAAAVVRLLHFSNLFVLLLLVLVGLPGKH